MMPFWLLSAVASLKRIPSWARWGIGVATICALTLSLAECNARRLASSAVKLDRVKASMEVSSRALDADRAATANQMARDAIATNQQQELRDEARKGDTSPVGPGTRAVLDRMREQQSKGGR